MGEYQGTGIPLPLTVEALEPSKSRDVIEAHFEAEWSELRSGRAGRRMYCFVVCNVTKGNQYEAEFFEDDQGKPFGWDNCASSVCCKHLKHALADLRIRYPEFGKSVFGGEERWTRKLLEG